MFLSIKVMGIGMKFNKKSITKISNGNILRMKKENIFKCRFLLRISIKICGWKKRLVNIVFTSWFGLKYVGGNIFYFAEFTKNICIRVYLSPKINRQIYVL